MEKLTCQSRALLVFGHHDTALPFKTTQYVRTRMELAPEVEERRGSEGDLDRRLLRNGECQVRRFVDVLYWRT
jgi:hypothetical protein